MNIPLSLRTVSGTGSISLILPVRSSWNRNAKWLVQGHKATNICGHELKPLDITMSPGYRTLLCQEKNNKVALRIWKRWERNYAGWDHLLCARYCGKHFILVFCQIVPPYEPTYESYWCYSPNLWMSKLRLFAKFELGVSDSRIWIFLIVKLLLDIWFLFLFHKDSERPVGFHWTPLSKSQCSIHF